MAKKKELRKPKKFVAGISCAALAVLTLIPATAVSRQGGEVTGGLDTGGGDFYRGRTTSLL